MALGLKQATGYNSPFLFLWMVTANFCLGIVGGEGLQRHQVLAGFQGLHGVGGFSISVRVKKVRGWKDYMG